ncbi:MAG: AraC family transcriptional regulator [Saprospiraceae bacterium]
MKPILELIPLEQRASILAFRHDEKNFGVPWHFHPQHELTFIEESTGTKFIGDYVGAYQPGELVLLRSNLPHCWKNYEQPEVHARSTVIQWNRGVFAKVPELDGVFKLIKTASRGILFSQKDTKLILPMVQQLPKDSGPDLYIGLLMVLRKLAECSYQTLSEASFIEDLPSEIGNRMAKVHDFVEAHFHRKVYLKELATLVNMSEQSFSRFFSKMMGRPFFTFLNEYRINMATRMLLDTHLPIAQIAYRCGYDSLPFFHKQFNKFKLESPSKYRRKYR